MYGGKQCANNNTRAYYQILCFRKVIRLFSELFKWGNTYLLSIINKIENLTEKYALCLTVLNSQINNNASGVFDNFHLMNFS